MLLTEKMKNYPFSNSESNIIDYLFSHTKELHSLTIKELSEKTFASPSTFIRISHKLGFKGWNEFKEAFLKECDYLETHFTDIDANYPFKQNDTIMSIAAKIAQLEQETIADTLSLITHDELQKALSIIRKASVIHVFAVSNNLYLAQQFAHQLSRIRRKVEIHSLQSEIVFNAVLAEEDSCAIVISYSGETDVLKKCIRALKTNAIPVIAITNVGENTIARLSDVVLKLCTRERLYSKISTYTVNTSVQYLLDVLYSCIFAEHYDDNLKLKIQTSEMIESGRYSSLDIIKEDEHTFLY